MGVQEQEADVLAESVEEAFTDGMVRRYIDVPGVEILLEHIKQRGVSTGNIAFISISSFALGVTLGRSIGNLDRLMEGEKH